MGREEQVSRAAWLLAVIAHGSQAMALLSVVGVALRQGRAHRNVGCIALSRAVVLGLVTRILSPASAASAVCHISFFVLWSLPDGMPSDRSRGIPSPAPLRVCLACIALKLPVLSSWVRSIRCGTAAVVLAVVVSSGTGAEGLPASAFVAAASSFR